MFARKVSRSARPRYRSVVEGEGTYEDHTAHGVHGGYDKVSYML